MDLKKCQRALLDLRQEFVNERKSLIKKSASKFDPMVEARITFLTPWELKIKKLEAFVQSLIDEQ